MDSSSQTQQPQQTKINPLQLLVNATFLAYQRGAYNMKEAAIISQAIDFFVETKQAEVPSPQPPQPPQPQQPSKRPETIMEEPSKVIFESQ
jgi:hypothetical protein